MDPFGRLIRAGTIVYALLSSTAAFPTLYNVSIDTSALAGSPFAVAYDFVDGGPPSNSVTVSVFSTDGILGVATPTGGVTGSLPAGFTVTDTAFFNEYLQVLSSATELAFRFEATSNAPDPSSLPDTFSFFLLDTQSQFPLFDTTDPTGAASLFTLQIDGSSNGLLSVYSPAGTGPAAQWTVTAVPEPTTLWLLAAGILAAVTVRRMRKV